jgi:ribosomal protein S18 acetylase RimI-like enzyme
MEIIKFNPKQDDSENVILKFLELHNEKNNLKMLSFTGIEFGYEFFNELVNSSENIGINQFYLKDENEILGFIVTKENIMFGFELLAMVIDNRHRGKGHAKKLINFAVSNAKKNSYKMVFVNVFADNKLMLKILLDLDFIPVNIQHHTRYDGADLIILQKRFD